MEKCKVCGSKEIVQDIIGDRTVGFICNTCHQEYSLSGKEG